MIVEHGEWEPVHESVNVDELPETELHHRNPYDMFAFYIR